MTVKFQDSGQGIPIILLHAFPLSRKMWESQVAALTAENCRVICIDMRGFGENDNFADINTMEDMATDVNDLMESLEIERAAIGGLSMGGYVTFDLYRQFPEKFSALLLFDTNSAADTEEKRRSRFELIDKIERQGAQALIDEMLPNLVCEFTKENKPELIEKIKTMFREVNPKAAVAALRGMAERKDNTALLKNISVPTLMIFGEEDKVTNLEVADMMKSQIPNSSLIKIEKAGHYSNLEQSEAFNSALTSFIKTIEI